MSEVVRFYQDYVQVGLMDLKLFHAQSYYAFFVSNCPTFSSRNSSGEYIPVHLLLIIFSYTSDSIFESYLYYKDSEFHNILSESEDVTQSFFVTLKNSHKVYRENRETIKTPKSLDFNLFCDFYKKIGYKEIGCGDYPQFAYDSDSFIASVKKLKSTYVPIALKELDNWYEEVIGRTV